MVAKITSRCPPINSSPTANLLERLKLTLIDFRSEVAQVIWRAWSARTDRDNWVIHDTCDYVHPPEGGKLDAVSQADDGGTALNHLEEKSCLNVSPLIFGCHEKGHFQAPATATTATTLMGATGETRATRVNLAANAVVMTK